MKYLISLILVIPVFAVSAQDIDIYLENNNSPINNPPQVLVIFDNSNSMAVEELVPLEYDPGSSIYSSSANGGGNYDERFLYWVEGFNGSLDLNDVSFKRFNKLINACQSSLIPVYGLWRNKSSGNTKTGYEIINDGDGYDDYELIDGGVGYYTDAIAEYGKGAWNELILNNNGANLSDLVECQQDVLNNDERNPDQANATGKLVYPDEGLPVDNYKIGKDSYTHAPTATNLNGGSFSTFNNVKSVTLYSGHYLNYLYYLKTSHAVSTERTQRMSLARDAILELIEATPSVHYGMALFNKNAVKEGMNDGARIVSDINGDPSGLEDILNGMSDEDFLFSGNSPLCESLYEAYRYFTGRSVLYGKENGEQGRRNGDSLRDWGFESAALTPERDLNAGNNTYHSPFADLTCQKNVYVIIVTDGFPTLDNDADDAIRTLPNYNSSAQHEMTITANDVDSDPGNDQVSSLLPALSHWLYHNDIDDDETNGQQKIITYTIGFSNAIDKTDEDLLSKTAVNGGGQYFSAITPSQLTAALQKALLDIYRESSTLTSPEVASNSFNNARSLSSVYYSMFRPEVGPRWPGNVKKLKYKNDKIVGRDGLVAIDTNGKIADSAKTFWGGTAQCEGADSCSDGADVNRGGVAEYLQGLQPSSRTILTQSDGKTQTLEAFTPDNLLNGSAISDIASKLSVTDDDAIVTDLVHWARGLDIDDDDSDLLTNDMRHDIFGDPLHSKPLVINYGGGSAENDSSQDVRILVGTNAGFMHMFKDKNDNLSESWAFIPQELYRNLSVLRNNNSALSKVYGLDSTPVSYVNDANGDGAITAYGDSGDKAWLFFGMRRGGTSYYAMDITNPDSPTLKWQIDGGNGEFANLTYTWSEPVVTFVNTSVNGHNPSEPVLIFGAGYSESAIDYQGCGIYIVNANTGKLVHKFTDCGTGSGQFNSQFPASVATLDSDHDGFVDRLYAIDVDGTLWRMDLPNKLFSDNQTVTTHHWSHFAFAELSDANRASPSSSELRLFFNQPTLVRGIIDDVDNSLADDLIVQPVPFDGIVVGSGDRTKPNARNVQDKLFVLHDRNIVTRSYNTGAPEPLQYDQDLLDITFNPFQNTTAATLYNDIANKLSGKLGWSYNFSTNLETARENILDGEKSLSKVRVIGGVVYMTSYTPPTTTDTEQCDISIGGGRIYALDLLFGTRIYGSRLFSVEQSVPTAPVLYSTIDTDANGNETSKLTLIGAGAGDDGDGVLELKQSSGKANCIDGCQQGLGFTTDKLSITLQE